MGESYLAGSEYRDSSRKELILREALASLKGRRWHICLKNDEITVLVETEIEVLEVNRRENRIETGHLTLDDVYFELVNDVGLKLFFPLVQFREAEIFSSSLNICFDTFYWSFYAL
ncbi:MAG: hypothetical protein QMD16_11375 [Desulfitobacteriaceae bacterium]|nr:hypothetical protein [Desulfitobacteriaceae bacterium]MDI6879950.1 hypothetical protein [Desulfitobacteriaceae bacterium]